MGPFTVKHKIRVQVEVRRLILRRITSVPGLKSNYLLEERGHIYPLYQILSSGGVKVN